MTSTIQKLNYNGIEIQFDFVNGQLMANATMMCKAFDKRSQPNGTTQNRLNATLMPLEVKSDSRTPLVRRIIGEFSKREGAMALGFTKS